MEDSYMEKMKVEFSEKDETVFKFFFNLDPEIFNFIFFLKKLAALIKLINLTLIFLNTVEKL
jgi:hypothetical protein